MPGWKGLQDELDGEQQPEYNPTLSLVAMIGVIIGAVLLLAAIYESLTGG